MRTPLPRRPSPTRGALHRAGAAAVGVAGLGTTGSAQAHGTPVKVTPHVSWTRACATPTKAGVAVGGTAPTKAASTIRGRTESVRKTSSTEGTDSGCSSCDTKPSRQTDTGCSRRTVSDVAAVADPATGVAVHDSYGITAGWYTFGGTSASAPIIAGVHALGGTPSSGSCPARFPCTAAGTSALNDVPSGNNGTCGTSYLCTAATGHDGPTGRGTPEGVTAFTG